MKDNNTKLNRNNMSNYEGYVRTSEVDVNGDSYKFFPLAVMLHAFNEDYPHGRIKTELLPSLKDVATETVGRTLIFLNQEDQEPTISISAIRGYDEARNMSSEDNATNAALSKALRTMGYDVPLHLTLVVMPDETPEDVETPVVDVDESPAEKKPAKAKEDAKKKPAKTTKAKEVEADVEETVEETPVKTEEPVVEETVIEEPVKEEPVKEEPIKEEPVEVEVDPTPEVPVEVVEEPVREETVEVEETPVEEVPVEEVPVEEAPVEIEVKEEPKVEAEKPAVATGTNLDLNQSVLDFPHAKNYVEQCEDVYIPTLIKDSRQDDADHLKALVEDFKALTVGQALADKPTASVLAKHNTWNEMYLDAIEGDMQVATRKKIEMVASYLVSPNGTAFAAKLGNDLGIAALLHDLVAL